MAKLPKLKVKSSPWFPNEEVRDIDEAKHLFFSFAGTLLWIDGQVVTSQEELIQLAAQERYQGKEFLEAVVLLPLGGG